MSDTNCNDMYTLCEILTIFYRQAVSYNSIVSRLKACGLWKPFRCASNTKVSKNTDVTNLKNAADQSVAHQTYMDLVYELKRNKNMLKSDVEVIYNSTLVTTGGALLTSKCVLDALKERYVQTEAAMAGRAAKTVEAEPKKGQREQNVAERAAEGRSRAGNGAVGDVGQNSCVKMTAP